jgi:putative SOS response-associated peptidase YedK
MCGRFLVTSPASKLAEAFDLTGVEALAPRYNVAPSQEIATIQAGEAGRQLGLRRWGLIPHWAADPSIGERLINARSETAAQKPAFQDAFSQRRCIVPADGFYEWTARNRGHVPHCFRRRDGEMLAIAGLYDSWVAPGGGIIESCTLLTLEANAVVRPVHGRMPVLLRPEDFDAWLDPEETDPRTLSRLLAPSPPAWLEDRIVDSWVNDPRNDGPRCLAEAAGEAPSLF